MKNARQDGKTLSFTNNSEDDIASGDVVPLANRIAVAVTDISAGKSGSIDLEGVFELPKKSTDVVEFSEDLYWDTVNKRLTVTPDANTRYAGIATEDAGNGTTSVRCRLQCAPAPAFGE